MDEAGCVIPIEPTEEIQERFWNLKLVYTDLHMVMATCITLHMVMENFKTMDLGGDKNRNRRARGRNQKYGSLHRERWIQLQNWTGKRDWTGSAREWI